MTVANVHAKFIYRFATGLEIEVVINDYESAGDDLVIEVCERVTRRFVKITVEAQQRQPFYRCGRKCILEPSLEELNLIVQEVVATEQLLYESTT